MENNNNNIELEEQELDLVEETNEKPLKEYQKLLIIENDRKDSEKALNLLKFGCFEQKEVETVDFSVLELVEGAKAYKGAYKLYRNTQTYELVYILPLVEDNKGDENERTDLAPYAYDLICIEQMDNETYNMVYQAAKRNLPTFISRLYVTSWVLYIINALIALVMVLYSLFTSQNSIMDTLTLVFFYFGTYLAGALVTMPLMVLLTIKYKKYKEEK